MLAVQTLNLYNYHKKNDIYAIKLQLMISFLSSYLLKKQYDRVILYCDEKTAELVSDASYTEIRILPNNILVENGYGTLSKLYTYSNIEEEYIHFDIDYFLFKKIELKNEVICAYSETEEKCERNLFKRAYSGLIPKLKSNYDEFGINIINENYAMNVCVFGIPNIYHQRITNYFKRLNEFTENNINTIIKTYSATASPQWAIEQYLPAQFFLENGFKIKELYEYENAQIKGHSGYLRLYEMKNFSNIANIRLDDIDLKSVLLKYMDEHIGYHLWSSKGVVGIDTTIKLAIKEIFPDLYEKIAFVFNKNFDETINSKKIITFI